MLEMLSDACDSNLLDAIFFIFQFDSGFPQAWAQAVTFTSKFFHVSRYGVEALMIIHLNRHCYHLAFAYWLSYVTNVPSSCPEEMTCP